VARLAQNQSQLKARGAVRKGAAWLGGLVHCGRCGTRMRTWYTGNVTQPRYVCQAAVTARGEPLCQSVAARAVDEEVARSALLGLAPAALDVSLQVAADLQQQYSTIPRDDGTTWPTVKPLIRLLSRCSREEACVSGLEVAFGRHDPPEHSMLGIDPIVT